MKNTDLVVSFFAVYRVLLDDLLLNSGNYNINVDYVFDFSTFYFNIYNDNILYYKKELIMPYFQARTLKNMIRFHFINTCDITLSGIYITDYKNCHHICCENIRLNVSILDNELDDTFMVHDNALNKINKKIVKYVNKTV